MSMFWIGDPYFPYRYLGRMIWYVWSTSYSWTQNCTQFFPFWILVANLSSTSASCLSSLLMGRVLLWKPWLHWGLGLQFFLCKYEIPCPSATILIRKESSGRFEFAPENGSATHTYIFLVRIRIHNSTYLHFLFFFQDSFGWFPTPARIKSTSCGARIPVPLRPNVGHSGFIQFAPYPNIVTADSAPLKCFGFTSHDMSVIRKTKVSRLTKKRLHFSWDIRVPCWQRWSINSPKLHWNPAFGYALVTVPDQAPRSSNKAVTYGRDVLFIFWVVVHFLYFVIF